MKEVTKTRLKIYYHISLIHIYSIHLIYFLPIKIYPSTNLVEGLDYLTIRFLKKKKRILVNILDFISLISVTSSPTYLYTIRPIVLL